jgi:hypothetical protein
MSQDEGWSFEAWRVCTHCNGMGKEPRTTWKAGTLIELRGGNAPNAGRSTTAVRAEDVYARPAWGGAERRDESEGSRLLVVTGVAGIATVGAVYSYLRVAQSLISVFWLVTRRSANRAPP